MSNWLDKLKEYAPEIAGAVLSGGATLPALAMKAVADATGHPVTDMPSLEHAVASASPAEMVAVQQANNAFKVRMSELGNELTASKLADVQNARGLYKHGNAKADEVATQIMRWNLPSMVFLAALQVAVVVIAKKYALDVTIVAIVSNILGLMVNSLISERQSVVGFFFGSSLGSKAKSGER